MACIEHFIDNNGVSIHCLEYNADAPGTPLFIVPGMINSAGEVAKDIGKHLTSHAMILSIRGRGKSGSPASGWTVEDQSSDVTAVVNHFDYPEIALFGHSTGGSIAAGALPMISSRVTAFFIGDFAPFYPPYDSRWGNHILQLEDRDISDEAINGITSEAQYTDVSEHLMLAENLYIITGTETDSALQKEDIERITSMYPNSELIRLDGCSHEFLTDDPKRSVMEIERRVPKKRPS